MKILEKSFRKKGFFHECVYREEGWAIYKRRRAVQDAINDHYEIIRVTISPAYTLANVEFCESEHYPSAEQFGVLAWNCQTLEEAKRKLEKEKLHQKELAAIPHEKKRGRPKKI